MLTIEEMKQRKIQHGYTNTQLSEISGIPVGTINKIFSGQTRQPRRETLLALNRVLEHPSFSYPPISGASEQPSFSYPPISDTSGVFMLRDSAAMVGSSQPAPAGAFDGDWFPGKRQGEYTVDDYLQLPDDKRVELIDGYFYDMAAPRARHQLIVGEIHASLLYQIRQADGSCQVFLSPFDVVLGEDNKTIVQPDVLIICDPSILTEERAYGAPDFVLEVISPSTGMKDYLVKGMKYLQSGVREYWIIDPFKSILLIYYYEKMLPPEILPLKGKVGLRIFDGRIVIDLDEMVKYCM